MTLKTKRLALIAALFSTLCAAALGCSSGLSTQDATLRCDQERDAKDQCVNDAAYTQCIACHEECGDSCAVLESCPVQYACSDD